MRPTLTVSLVLVLTACSSMSDVRPGDGRKGTISGKTYDQVWTAATKVANEHFGIHEQRTRRPASSRPSGHSVRFVSGAYVGIFISPPSAAPTHTVEVVRRKKNTYGNLGEQDWEYKVIRDVYRELGLPALDPERDP